LDDTFLDLMVCKAIYHVTVQSATIEHNAQLAHRDQPFSRSYHAGKLTDLFQMFTITQLDGRLPVANRGWRE
jgi:hypothetical protein